VTREECKGAVADVRTRRGKKEDRCRGPPVSAWQGGKKEKKGKEGQANRGEGAMLPRCEPSREKKERRVTKHQILDRKGERADSLFAPHGHM